MGSIVKHQVLFFVSIFSCLSYASQYSRELADAHLGAQRFRMMRKIGRVDPIEELRFVLQCNEIARIPITADGKEKCLVIIQQAMQQDGSWNDLVEWSKLHNGPTKKCEIR